MKCKGYDVIDMVKKTQKIHFQYIGYMQSAPLIKKTLHKIILTFKVFFISSV